MIDALKDENADLRASFARQKDSGEHRSELKQKIAAEREHLIELDERRRKLHDQLSDFTNAGGLASLDRQIKDRKNDLESLKSQLNSNKSTEQLLSKNGKVAREYQ